MNEYELIRDLIDRLIAAERELSVLRAKVILMPGEDEKKKELPKKDPKQEAIWDDLKKEAKKNDHKTGPKPKIDREAVIQYKNEGMKVPEIAKLMGISQASAYAIIKDDRES